jgi:hypothetical protein
LAGGRVGPGAYALDSVLGLQSTVDTPGVFAVAIAVAVLGAVASLLSRSGAAHVAPGR